MAALFVSGGCVADETMPGGYAIGVNTDQQPAYVLALDYSVDGERQKIKIVETTGSSRIIDPAFPSHVKLANKTFNDALDSLLRKIVTGLK